MDITLPITGGAVIVLAGGFLGKLAVNAGLKKMKRWDDHVEHCEGERAVAHARLEGRVETLTVNQTRIEAQIVEIGGDIKKLLIKAGAD